MTLEKHVVRIANDINREYISEVFVECEDSWDTHLEREFVFWKNGKLPFQKEQEIYVYYTQGVVGAIFSKSKELLYLSPELVGSKPSKFDELLNEND